jgi:arginine utilization regulatory protein
MPVNSAVQKIRILIIDDNQQIHQDFKKILNCEEASPHKKPESSIYESAEKQHEIYQISCAFNGEEGLKMVEEALKKNNPYAVAFVDMRMHPGWDGIETVSRIWRIYPDLQVVICTAYSDYSWEEMIEKLEYSDQFLILKKPFDIIEVRQLTYALCKKWELTRIANLKMYELKKMVNEKTNELNKTKTIFENILNTSPMHIAFVDMSGKYAAWNKASEDMFGYKADEAIGKLSLTKFCINSKEAKFIINTAREKGIFEGEVSLIRKKGSEFPARFLAVKTIDSAGNHTGYTMVATDITERKLAEEALSKSEYKYRTLIETMTDIVYIVDVNGIFNFINHESEKIIGYVPQDLIGRPFTDIIPPEFIETTLDRFKLEIMSGAAILTETEFMHKNGNRVPVELNVTPLLDSEGRTIGRLGVARNIADRKRIEKELIVSERRSSLLEEEIIDLHRKIKGERVILGESEVIKNVFSQIEKVAGTDATVLVYGETGTGKESVAQAIHYNSCRKGEPFGVIDCAAIPSTLLETELFGYEKGAFTGAYTQTKGIFETSNDGTILLDEIEELPLHLQSKLLRVLQEKDIRRVGGSERIKVNVRLIATCNSKLKEFVNAGKLRLDLYYRLNVFPINLPPLRDRDGDIILLAQYFLSQFGRNKTVKGFTNSAKEALSSYHWPGNIRELQHKIERAVIMSNSEYLSAEDLEFDRQLIKKGKQIYFEGQTSVNYPIILTKNDIIRAEKEEGILPVLKNKIIKLVLKHTQGDIKKASRILGINQATVYRHLKKTESL